MVATASAEDYRRTIELLVQAEAADAIIAIFVPPLVTAAQDVARELHRVAGRMGGVGLSAVFMTSDGEPPQLNEGATQGRRIPSYYFPEDAARALAHAAAYARWRERPQGEYPVFDGCHPEESAAIITRALGAPGGGWLEPRTLAALLDCYGLPLTPTRVAANAREAVAAAAEIGGPVALKAVAEGLLHKSDAGGVRLGLGGSRAGARRRAGNPARRRRGRPPPRRRDRCSRWWSRAWSC